MRRCQGPLSVIAANVSQIDSLIAEISLFPGAIGGLNAQTTELRQMLTRLNVGACGGTSGVSSFEVLKAVSRLVRRVRWRRKAGSGTGADVRSPPMPDVRRCG
jgi:acetaldehyde dehydrogenase (acetylating)